MKQLYQLSSCNEHQPSLRPREQARTKGVQAMADRDLLAMVLGSGTKQYPVAELSKKVLERLDRTSALDSEAALEGIPGLGPAKRLQLVAAVELFRRIYISNKPRIRKPHDVMPFLQRWADREQEHFLCLSLNGAHEVFACRVVSIGTLNRTIVHPREVFSEPIRDRAAAVIVAHNHPSGNIEPSDEDVGITRRLQHAGNILGIELLDHIVFSRSEHCSLLEKGLMKT